MDLELYELYTPKSNVFLYTNMMLKQKKINPLRNDTKIAKNILDKYKVFLKLISI